MRLSVDLDNSDSPGRATKGRQSGKQRKEQGERSYAQGGARPLVVNTVLVRSRLNARSSLDDLFPFEDAQPDSKVRTLPGKCAFLENPDVFFEGAQPIARCAQKVRTFGERGPWQRVCRATDREYHRKPGDWFRPCFLGDRSSYWRLSCRRRVEACCSTRRANRWRCSPDFSTSSSRPGRRRPRPRSQDVLAGGRRNPPADARRAGQGRPRIPLAQSRLPETARRVPGRVCRIGTGSRSLRLDLRRIPYS